MEGKVSNRNTRLLITGDILHMIKKKESVRRKLRTSSSVYLITKFKQLRSTVKRMISDSRAKYFENLEQDIVKREDFVLDYSTHLFTF